MIRPHPRSGRAFAGMKIGLLGGSFNPAHDGHRAMSIYALKRLGIDQVWWMVSPQNPLKSTKGMAPLKERMKQASAFADHRKIVVTDIEDQLGTRYTIDTLEALQKHFPATRFLWLMGADNLQQMTRWKKWPQIFSLVPVAVFRRPAYAIGHGFGKVTQRFKRYGLPISQAKNIAKFDAPAWMLLDNPKNKISATEIRKTKN
ncbi:MAG: nicotinate-nucleotide adenylyltransferase [Alphaproteobacteria bacterium]